MVQGSDDLAAPTKLAVVIAARDAAGTLGEQLDALAAQDAPVPVEVIVVDNGSTDATAELVHARAAADPRVRLVSAPEGRGAGHARNAGVASTDARWLAFCDADDIVAQGWLAAMTRALAHHELVAGPLELDRLNPEWLVESRGRSFATEPNRFLDVFPAASSCNMAVHRARFDEVGGFDESFLAGQDLELSMRLWQAGVELHFEPEAVVHYRYRPSLAAVFAQSRRFGAVQPVLEARLRQSGQEIPSGTPGLRRWLWLVRNLPRLRTRAGRARWLFVAGRQIGRLRGGRLSRRDGRRSPAPP